MAHINTKEESKKQRELYREELDRIIELRRSRGGRPKNSIFVLGGNTSVRTKENPVVTGKVVLKTINLSGGHVQVSFLKNLERRGHVIVGFDFPTPDQVLDQAQGLADMDSVSGLHANVAGGRQPLIEFVNYLKAAVAQTMGEWKQQDEIDRLQAKVDQLEGKESKPAVEEKSSESSEVKAEELAPDDTEVDSEKEPEETESPEVEDDEDDFDSLKKELSK